MTTYTQALYDDFPGTALNPDLWQTPDYSNGISVSGGTLQIQGITNYEQVVVETSFDRNLAGGIFGLQLSQSGTADPGTMWFLGIADNYVSDGGNAYEFQTFPNDDGGSWYSWAFTGTDVSGDTGNQDILSPSVWVNGDWLAIGNFDLNGENDVHVYKSSDGESFTEIASWTVTGAIDESATGFYFGTNFNPGAGSSTYLATISNVSWFTRESGGGGGSSYSLFSQAAETVSEAGSTGGGSLGVEFSVSEACTLGELWLYSPSGQGLTGVPATIALYVTSGETLVTSQAATWGGAAGSGWISAPFSSPPSLTAGTSYTAAAYDGSGTAVWFAYDDDGWPENITNGPLTAVAANQGLYDTSTSGVSYPSDQLSGYNWYLDVEVTTSGSSALTATAALTVTPERSVTTSGGTPSRPASASLTVTPALAATAVKTGLVQVTSGHATGTSLTLTFPAAVTLNNAVIVCVAGHYDGTVNSIALGTTGGSFTHLGGAGGSGGNNADIYMLPAAGQSTATLTIVTSSAGIIAFAYELTGAVVYFDVIKGSTGTGTSWSSGSSAETINWPHVIIGIGAVVANSGSVTGPSGWANVAITNVAGADSHAIGAVSGYLQEPSAVSCTYSGTAAASSAWGAAVAAFLVVPRGGNAWGGYEFNEHAAAGYTGVTCTFTIPSSLPSTAGGECSVWVGIGNVYQVGIFLSPDSSNTGNVATSPWSWWFGGGGGAGELWSVATYPTGAGNSLSLSLTVDETQWYATITNHTLGWTYTEVRSVLGLNVSTTAYNGTTGVPTTWGWIYPVPFAVVVIEQEETDLPQYGTITFTGITTTPPISQAPDPQFTAFSATGGISQYPGPFNLAEGSYSMIWNSET